MEPEPQLEQVAPPTTTTTTTRLIRPRSDRST
jgi:hypothetical protein